MPPAAPCRGQAALFHPRVVGAQDSIIWSRYIQPVLASGLQCQLLCPEIPWQKEALSAFGWGWTACARDLPGFELELRQGATRLIFLLGQQLASLDTETGERQQRSVRRVKEMMSCIQANYARDLTLEEIAASAGISPSEALRCFKTTLGDTPVHFLQQYRVEAACKILTNTDLKIQTVCERCGFGETGYFTKVFRQARGCTPSQWRKMYRADR